MNTTSRHRLRAAGTAVTALLLAGLVSSCGATADQSATASATVGVSSDAASEGAAPSDGESSSTAPSDAAETLSYEGRTGATALELLLEADPSAEVTGKGENAFVTAIDGRTADDAASEFWALSVDGEPAQVGAGTLETEDGQEITWTLETY